MGFRWLILSTVLCVVGYVHGDVGDTVSWVQRGSKHKLDYRLYFTRNGSTISPFHDIPLLAQDGDRKLYNMVVEIPRWTNAKMEIATKEPMNPLKQDEKSDTLRYVKNVFPYHGYMWNYGYFPQTWENPTVVDHHTGQKGDGDPIDVLEIGQKVHPKGSVIHVKVLGIIALVDEGETDWKVFTIDVADPQAGQIEDMDDVEKLMPGFLKASVYWFKVYKIPDGNPANKFAFEGNAKDPSFAESVIKETHKQWEELIQNRTDSLGLDCKNVNITGSPYIVEQNVADAVVQGAPPAGPDGSIPSDADKWYYIEDPTPTTQPPPTGSASSSDVTCAVTLTLMAYVFSFMMV